MRAGRCWPAFFFAIVAILCAPACYSSDYRRSTAANVALLSDMADKLADYCRADFKLDDRQLSSEEMGEFYYAFNKASGFANSTSRDASRPSHRDFVKLLGAYDQLVRAADSYRLSGKPDPATLASILSAHDTVKTFANTVSMDLRAEH